jgi:hypothetical protein
VPIFIDRGAPSKIMPDSIFRDRFETTPDWHPILGDVGMPRKFTEAQESAPGVQLLPNAL